MACKQTGRYLYSNCHIDLVFNIYHNQLFLLAWRGIWTSFVQLYGVCMVSKTCYHQPYKASHMSPAGHRYYIDGDIYNLFWYIQKVNSKTKLKSKLSEIHNLRCFLTIVYDAMVLVRSYHNYILRVANSRYKYSTKLNICTSC